MLIYILLLLSFIMLMLFLLINQLDYMSPTILFLAPFTVSILFAALYANEWGIQMNAITFFLLIFGFLSFFIGERLGKGIVKGKNRNKNNVSNVSNLEIPMYKYVIIIIYELSAFFIYYKALVSIVSLKGYKYILFDSTYAKEMSSEVGFFVSTINKLAIVFAYLCTLDLIYNYVFKKGKRIKKICDIIVILIYLFTVLLTGSRGDVINYGVSFLFLLYVLICKKKGWTIKEYKKMLIKIIPACMTVIIGFFLLKNIVKKSGQMASGFLDIISSYMGAQIDLLDRLVSNNKYGISYNYIGYESFNNMYQFLNKIGVIKDMPDIPFYYRAYNYIGCNVYTFFRRPYVDFGFLGCLFITMLCGYAFGYIYYKKIKNRNTDKKSLLSLLIYAFFINKVVMAFFDDYITIQISMTTAVILVLFFVMYKFVFFSHVRICLKKERIHVFSIDKKN